MSNSDDPPSSPAVPASRGFRALLRQLRRRGETRNKPEPERPEPLNGEPDMVDQAQAFQSLRVAQVMTPRTDINALEITDAFEDVVARFTEAEHSRMPVYRDTLDDPLGVVHMKDVFKLMSLADGERPGPADPSCTSFAATPTMCPPRCAPPTCCCACAPRASTWPWSSTSSAAPMAW